MKMNMNEVLKQWIAAERKKPIPILTFPIAQKMGLTVTELLADAATQAKGLKLLSQEVDPFAILTYMDLSIEAEAFGGKVDFDDNEIPNIHESICQTREDVEALKVPEVGAGRTQIYIDGAKMAVELIADPEKPIFAGCIGPFSLAGRLMDITDVMMKCVGEPETIHLLLEKCTEFVLKYMKAYKDAGLNGIAMAEPLAGLMSPKMLDEFSSQYVKRIIDELQDDHFAVIYHNCGGSTVKAVKKIAATGAIGYSFGNIISMEKMMAVWPDANHVVMGNVDPAGEFCNGTPESIRQATLKVMEACAKYPNFIPASGCDIPAHSPWENIHAFFDAVDEYYESH